MPKIFAVAFLGLVIVWGAGELNAQDKWSHEVTPAFWVAGGDGEISFLSEDGPVKLVFDDMWRMEPGLALTIQGNRTRLGYILDVSYGRTAIGDYDWSLMFLNAGGTYRLSNGDTGVNLVFGVRHASTSGGLRVPTGEDPDEEGDDDAFKKLRANDGWVDGFVGLQVRHPFGSRWVFDGYFDAGAGTSSLTFQIAAGFSYELSSRVSAKAGYRLISADHDDSTADENIMFGGFYGGVGFRF
jgi:opacity protein-like surface antigen